MIVDDHEAFRQVIKAQLQTIGAECVECVDGRDALAQYPGCQPDVVLMDISMKGLDGLSATAQITARFPAARIVMLTEYDDDDLRQAAQEAGALGYLLKDDLSRLPAVLEQALRTPTLPGHPIPPPNPAMT